MLILKRGIHITKKQIQNPNNMSRLSKEERDGLFDDLIEYYRFCKRDERNHIFNAINAIRKDKEQNKVEELKAAQESFRKAKATYLYYYRMKNVALLLKLNLSDFTTANERFDLGRALIEMCFNRAKQESLHWSLLEKRVKEFASNEACSEELNKLLEELQKANTKNLNSLQKLDSANILFKEIV